ncbi:hypothetical protein MMC08_007053 [Hypocenomyce scalaris]|nr:hypothetical protein [Hypocenomyce scalaris]
MSNKVKWDEHTDLQLLLAVIAVNNAKIDYDIVTTMLGFGCSPRAIEERLKKLKKRARETFGGTIGGASAALSFGSAGNDHATNTHTTTKRKAPDSELTSHKKSKKGAKVKEFEDDDGSDEEEGGLKLENAGEIHLDLSNLSAGDGILLEDASH